MRFREYGDNSATLREWSRQLNIASKGNYPLYPTIENTLNHWKDELNKTLDTNTFGIQNTPEATIKNWQDKLNNIYSR